MPLCPAVLLREITLGGVPKGGGDGARGGVDSPLCFLFFSSCSLIYSLNMLRAIALVSLPLAVGGVPKGGGDGARGGVFIPLCLAVLLRELTLMVGVPKGVSLLHGVAKPFGVLNSRLAGVSEGWLCFGFGEVTAFVEVDISFWIFSLSVDSRFFSVVSFSSDANTADVPV